MDFYSGGASQRDEYRLKYLTTDTIKVQYAISTSPITPVVRLVNVDTDETINITPVQISFTNDYIIYNVTLSGLSAGCYVLKISMGEIEEWAPFSIHEELEGSKLLTYNNFEDDFQTIFSDDPFNFRIDGIFVPGEEEFNVEANNFRDQRYVLGQLSAFPYDVNSLRFGGNMGAPNSIGSKINRIFSCSTVLIDGDEYTRSEGSDGVAKEVWSPVYHKYPFKVKVEKKSQGAKVIITQSAGFSLLNVPVGYNLRGKKIILKERPRISPPAVRMGIKGCSL